MKTSKKVLSVILTIATLIGIFSCATTVFAEDYNEYTDNKAYQEKLLTETVDSENEQAEIICEVEEKRDEYSKTYKRADGSFTSVLSQTPLHKRENGEWMDIDNTLKSEDNSITNTDGAFDIEFPETITENEKITVSNGDESIAFSVKGIENADGIVATAETEEADIIKSDLNKTVSQITYENVDDNTDIQYVVSSNSVKENIIVSDKSSLKETYSFDIEKGNLSATLDNENNLLFKNAENETVFTIPAPVMTDASNAVSYDIEVEIQNADNSIMTLIYTPSKEWLESSERAYPVVIDPVFILDSSRGKIIEDTVIAYSSDNPGNENKTAEDSVWGFVADIEQTENGETEKIKSNVLVKVNMDVFSGLKHSNISVTDVNYIAEGAVADGNIMVKSVNGSWRADEITYTAVYPTDGTEPAITYGNEIIDYYTGFDSTVSEATETAVSLNITELFNGWLSGENENNGFAILAEEGAMGLLFLDGYIEAINNDKKTYYQTYISVDYVDTSASNDSFEYLTQEIGRAGTATVNTFSRGMSINRSDLSMDGLRMPVSVGFNYNPSFSAFITLYTNIINAVDNEEIALPEVYGRKWYPSYLQGAIIISDNQVQVFTEEGTLVSFNVKEEIDSETEASTIIFEEDETSDSGYSLEFVDQSQEADITNFKLTNPNGEEVYFNEYGLATEICEQEPNSDGTSDKITITYDAENPIKINCVTDGIGRKYNFIYDSETGLLSEIKCLTADGTPIKAGTTDVDLKVTYGYDDNGNLTTVTYPDGETVTYTYDNNGNLIKATNIDGYNIQYTYDALGKVTNIAEYADTTPGNTINLTQLSNRQVKVIDGYNGTETYQFGRDGRLHYTFDEKGNYYKSDYAPANDETVYSSYDWKITSENLLENGSFEEIQNAKAVGWSNSFNVEDIETSATITDYACRVSSIESTTALQSQTVNVDGGKTYTFSFYAKANTETGKLYAKIDVQDADGNGDDKYRQFSVSEEFEQYSITITPTEEISEISSVTVEFGLKNQSGDFYVNNAQLEKGYGTAPFNYIKNGSFNNSNDNWSTATLVDETLNQEPVKAVKLSGGLPSYNVGDGLDRPADTNYLDDHISAVTQNVEINGKKGETYSVGGWFKGQFDDNYISVRAEGSDYANALQQLTNSSAQIKVTYSYTDTVTTTDEATNETTTTEQTLTENFVVDFVAHNDGWQYAVDTFALKGDTETVDITVMAKNIPEDCFVTGIELTLDNSSTLLENEEESTTEEELSSAIALAEESTDLAEECICEDCEEFNCDCRCASEILCNCVQCKRGTTKEYDNYGNVILTLKTDGVSTMTTETTYSTDGNSLAGAKDENEVVSTFTESAEKDTALPLQVSVAGRTSDYTFNAGTHLETVNKTVSGLESGNQMPVAYSYDNDRITKVTTNGYSYNFEYDKWGNIAREKVGNQVIANYYYGANQYNKQLYHILYENGQSVRYGYDTLGNVNAIKYSNDADWRFTFDYTNSKKTTITDKVQNQIKEITEKGYTITDLLTDQVIYSKTDTTEKFNGAEYTKTINDEVYEQADGTTLQSYVLSGVANSTKTLGFSKLADWFGRDEKKTVSVNGSALSLEKEFKYKDGAEQNSTTKYIEEISNSIKINDTVNSAETLKYTYDSHGNVKTISSCINDVTTMQYEYYYDEANQIVRVDDYINNITTTYQYDMGGNIVFSKEFERESYTAESVAINEDVYVYDSAWKDKISRVNGNAMTYDLIGNLLTYDGKTHTWIAGRKLATFQNADYSLSFTYDENGLRSSKTVNHNGTNKTIKYTWVDGKLIGQMDGADTLRFIYDDSEDIVGFIKNDSEIYLYIKNIFGDIIGIVDETGSVVVEYEYDVWGKLMYVSGTLAETLGKLNPIRYRGYYYDSESGYYYLQSRYYDPELRRFINADKLENLYAPKNTYLYADSVNIFAYCANSPVNMVDYSGEKEAVNSGVMVAVAFVFVVTLLEFDKYIIIKSDKELADKGKILYKKSKKGVIAIQLYKSHKFKDGKKTTKYKFSEFLFDFYEVLGDKVFDVLGIYALERFYNDFKDIHNIKYPKDTTKRREFLFSDYCVIQEIKHHCLGYWYTEDRIPLRKTSYRLYFGSKITERDLKDACKQIDIAEQDVFDFDDSMAFGYFALIRSKYLYTMADPYWYGEFGRINDPRVDWKTKKIPWNAKLLVWE